MTGGTESWERNSCHGRTYRRVLPAENLPPLPARGVRRKRRLGWPKRASHLARKLLVQRSSIR